MQMHLTHERVALAVSSQASCTKKRLFSFIEPGTISTPGERERVYAVPPVFDVQVPNT